MSGALRMPSPNQPCAFCDYLCGRRQFTILHRFGLVAVLVTREQRGVGHVLVVPVAHRPTLLDLTATEAPLVMNAVIKVADAIARAYKPAGIAVWQNNGVQANQTIPHLHFHVAGTLPEGGTDFGNVRELAIEETKAIAERLRPFIGMDRHH